MVALVIKVQHQPVPAVYRHKAEYHILHIFSRALAGQFCFEMVHDILFLRFRQRRKACRQKTEIPIFFNRERQHAGHEIPVSRHQHMVRCHGRIIIHPHVRRNIVGIGRSFHRYLLHNREKSDRVHHGLYQGPVPFQVFPFHGPGYHVGPVLKGEYIPENREISILSGSFRLCQKGRLPTHFFLLQGYLFFSGIPDTLFQELFYLCLLFLQLRRRKGLAHSMGQDRKGYAAVRQVGPVLEVIGTLVFHPVSRMGYRDPGFFIRIYIGRYRRRHNRWGLRFLRHHRSQRHSCSCRQGQCKNHFFHRFSPALLQIKGHDIIIL